MKQSWASIETLSPVLHSSPKREARPVRSAQNIDNTTRITRNALSETKVINCELSEEAQRTFRRIDKTHSVYKTTEDVSSLKEMQQIPTVSVLFFYQYRQPLCIFDVLSLVNSVLITYKKP